MAVRNTLAGSIDRHLLADGLDPASLDLWAGGAALDESPCLEERRRTLAAGKPVTVVIATRNRPERLDACLDTILALDYPAFDIVVVDNDPTTSDTVELVSARGAATGRIRYLREDRRGLGAAHNRGLAAASGSIVAFTDDDVAVDRHWLSELAAPFVADPGVAGATGLIMPAELETPAQLMLEVHGRFSKGFEGPPVRPRPESTRRRVVPLRHRQARLGGQHGVRHGVAARHRRLRRGNRRGYAGARRRRSACIISGRHVRADTRLPAGSVGPPLPSS